MVTVRSVLAENLGKGTENNLLPSFDVVSFIPLFHYDGGMLGMNLYKIKNLLSLKHSCLWKCCRFKSKMNQ